MNTAAYLNKLGLDADEASLPYLKAILARHIARISFSNLAVFFRPGQMLALDLPSLFAKVILHGEGGYCFENNKMLFQLLRALEFDCTAKLGRVVFGRQAEDIPRTHRVTIVTLDGVRYLCDVGFGPYTPVTAVPLDGSVVEAHGTRYRIAAFPHGYRLEAAPEDQFLPLYTFDDGIYEESDFSLSNYYTNTHPDSKFVKQVVVSRRDGVVTEFIVDRTFSRIDNGVRTDRQIVSQEDFDESLARFHITRRYDFTRLPAS